MNYHFPTKSLFAILFVCALFSMAAFVQEKAWWPFTPHELKLAAPKVEADAEVKIFNERGREQFSKMDIPFWADRGSRLQRQDQGHSRGDDETRRVGRAALSSRIFLRAKLDLRIMMTTTN